MQVLIIGQGGREHAIAWKIAQSPKVKKIFVAPGNAGTSLEPKVTNIALKYSNTDDLNKLLTFAQSKQINLTIVGPETPLVLGIVDLFQKNNLTILGPTQAAAHLEGSKVFCKQILTEANIPTASYQEFSQSELEQALEYISHKSTPYIIKADGLAAGKGVSIITTQQQGIDIINKLFVNQSLGQAAAKIIIEDFIEGQEISFIALIANNTIIPLASAQDHKTRDDGDLGPNTGGMGAYSPTLLITPELSENIITNIIRPTLDTLQKHHINYNGFLFAGLIIDKNNKVFVLEYNCRLGDPETQAILPRLESDFFDLCYVAATNDFTEKNINLKWSEKSAITVVLASKNYPDLIIKDEIIKINNFNSNSAKIFHAATYLDNNNLLRTNGGRVLTVTQLEDNLSLAQEKVYHNIENIFWPSMFFRKDIGFKAL